MFQALYSDRKQDTSVEHVATCVDGCEHIQQTFRGWYVAITYNAFHLSLET